jgi:tRNA 2-thiocytidine biosynthesis protein TtcA
MKDARTTLSKLTEVAIRRYEMVQPEDKILIAVSGGKDSSCLAWDLALKRQWWDVPFDITACHVATDLADQGYAKPTDEGWLSSRMKGWGIPYVRIDVPVAGRLKPGETMNCYWCATQRRTELMKYAQAHGFNKLALGHHMDDMLETLFMNMMKKGEFATMPPIMPYKKYPLTVIRPLSLCEERQIIACAEELDLTSFTCSCSFNLEGERKKTRRLIDQITGNSSHVKRNIFASMSRVRPDYLA